MEQEFKRQKVDLKWISESHLAKWPIAVLEEGFVPFPKTLIRAAPKLFAGEMAMDKLALVLAIVDYLRPVPHTGPSLEYLAFVAGLSADAARAALVDLDANKLVQFHEQRDGRLKLLLDGLYERIEEIADE